MKDKNKSNWMAKIGAIGGKARTKSKGFGADPAKASWAGRIGGLTKRLGRKPSKAEVEQLKAQLTKE